MIQRHSNILTARINQPCRTLSLTVVLYLLPQMSIAFTPLDPYLIQGIFSTITLDLPHLGDHSKSKTLYNGRFNSPPLPLYVNVIHSGTDHSEASHFLAELQKNYPQLAQFLEDVAWVQNSDLIALLNFFQTHSEEAQYFNTHGFVTLHTTGQVVDINEPVIVMMQFIQSNPSTAMFKLLQKAPGFAQIIMDSINPAKLIRSIDHLLNFPDLLHFIEHLILVREHNPGTSISNNHPFLTHLLSLLCLGNEPLQAINDHIFENNFYFSLMRYLRSVSVGNELSELPGAQLVALVQHPNLLAFFQSIVSNIHFEPEEVHSYMHAMADCIIESKKNVTHQSYQALLALIIRRLYASQISSMQSSPLVNHLETCALPHALTGEDSAQTVLFLISHHQNLLAYLNGQNAQFNDTDFSQEVASFSNIVMTNASLAHDELQNMVDNPAQIGDNLAYINGLTEPTIETESEATVGSPQNLVAQAVDLENIELVGEIVNSFLTASSLGQIVTASTDSSVNTAHLGVLLLASQGLLDNHPVSNVLVATACYSAVPHNEFEPLVIMTQTLLQELGMMNAKDYDRIRFVIRLIAQMATSNMRPFNDIEWYPLLTNYPTLLKIIKVYLHQQVTLSDENIEQAALVVIYMLISHPQLFVALGPTHMASSHASNKELIQLLNSLPENIIQQLLEPLFIQPALLVAPSAIFYSGNNLELFMTVLTHLNAEHFSTMTGFQLFLFNTALISHSSAPVSTTPPDGLAAHILRQKIYDHLLSVWPEQTPLNSDILIAYLFSQIDGLEQAMTPESVMKLLKRYFR